MCKTNTASSFLVRRSYKSVSDKGILTGRKWTSYILSDQLFKMADSDGSVRGLALGMVLDNLDEEMLEEEIEEGLQEVRLIILQLKTI